MNKNLIEPRPQDIFNYLDRLTVTNFQISDGDPVYRHIHECPMCYSAAEAYSVFSFENDFISNPRIFH